MRETPTCASDEQLPNDTKPPVEHDGTALGLPTRPGGKWKRMESAAAFGVSPPLSLKCVNSNRDVKLGCVGDSGFTSLTASNRSIPNCLLSMPEAAGVVAL